MSKEEKIELSMVEGFSKNIVDKLISHGFETADEVLDAGKESLLKNQLSFLV